MIAADKLMNQKKTVVQNAYISPSLLPSITKFKNLSGNE
jgi:hypothetical protein